MKFLLTGAAGFAACCVMSALYAQGQPTHDCARVTDNAARLACYDRAFGQPAQVPQADAAASPKTAPAAAPAARPGPATAPTPPPEEFGFKRGEIERSRAEEEQAPPPAESITAKVTAVESRRGQFTATLDNGQVWTQIEINSKVQLEAGDSVTVRRAVFGSYLLTGPQGVATRVRRLR